MELWVWGRTVDYEDAAPLPTACGPVQWGDTGRDGSQGSAGLWTPCLGSEPSVGVTVLSAMGPSVYLVGGVSQDTASLCTPSVLQLAL